MMLINDLDKCNKAVPWIKSVYPNIPGDVKIENDILYPKGCNVFVNKHKSYGIFFNMVSSNKPNKHARQVCVRGKLFI